VHVGLGPALRKVDVEVTTMTGRQRVVTRRAGVEIHAGVIEVIRTP
jgi:hypothetical protein